VVSREARDSARTSPSALASGAVLNP
jgi:hypothetical protein